MSPEWGSIPLLPLRCILDHLSLEDALAAMSVCRHWRSAALLYEGHKDTIKLNAKNLEKCLYLTRLFRKHTKKLHIYLNVNKEELDKFMSYVLPQYFETVELQELLFIGPNYMQQNNRMPDIKLKRIITESLIHKHSHSLRRLSLFNCEMAAVNSENERFLHKQLEYYSRSLTFNHMPAPCDAVLTRCNTNLMVFSALQHIMVDYEHINTDALETLSELTNFTRLTLNVGYERKKTYHPLDWDRLDTCYPNGLEVAVNIIGLPEQKFDEVINNVLREGMPLISIKILFCETMYTPLLEHVVHLYKHCLRELVWADCPYESFDPCARVIRPQPERQEMGPYSLCNVNPFILVCWKCTHLQRLAIHGYWVWQYDLLGCARLRRSLARLEAPALYARQDRFPAAGAVRVLVTDAPPPVDRHLVHEINEYTEFKWKPLTLRKVHPGLRARSTNDMRAAYVLQEALQPLGIT